MNRKAIAAISYFLLVACVFVQASDSLSVLSRGWSTPDILKSTNPEYIVTSIDTPAANPRDLRQGNEQANSNCYSVEGSTPGAVVTAGSRSGQTISESMIAVGFVYDALQTASYGFHKNDVTESVAQEAGEDATTGNAKEDFTVQNGVTTKQGLHICCCLKK